MQEWLITTGEWALAIVAIVYLLLPLAIKFSQYHAAWPTKQAITPDQVSPDVAQFMAETEAVMRTQEFYAIALLRSEGSVPGVTADILLFLHQPSGDTAGVILVRSAVG